jgi:outer membrane protein assembly factor BamB
MKPILPIALIPIIVITNLFSQDWRGFRGPTGMGVIEGDAELPLKWDSKTGENVLWKTPLPIGDGTPDHNQSSPIIIADKVITTNCVWEKDKDPKKVQPAHHVTCHSLKYGKLLWDKVFQTGPWTLSDLRGGYAAPTPVSDGKRIFAAFGSSILHALTMDGEVLWSHVIPDHESFDVAMSASPVLFDNTLILLTDCKAPKSSIQAFDPATGKILWQRAREKSSFGHVTPVLTQVNGKPQLLVSETSALQGLNPRDGSVIWSCKWGRSIWPVAAPVTANGLIFCMGGRGGHPGLIVDPTGKGDVTETHLKTSISSSPEGLGSPVAYKDLVFRINQPGILRCFKASTGEELYKERLPQGIDPAISPVIDSKGRIFIASAGKTVVLQASDTFELLAESDLGDASRASAAVSNGKLILKGKTHLWCIGIKE